MKKGTNLGVPLSSTPPSVQHISSTQKGHFLLAPKSLSSTPKIPQFQTKKPLSSTSKTPQFYTPLNFTPKTGGGVFVYLFEVFDVELRGFRCGTEGVSVLNWGVFGVELSDFGVELRDFRCWRGVVLVWNRCVKLRGTRVGGIRTLKNGRFEVWTR